MTGLLSFSSAADLTAVAEPRGPGSSWNRIVPDYAGYMAVGSLLLYLCGYLSLRTEITALGIPAEFASFDERYIFAGASFLVYFVFSVAQLALAAGGVALLLWAASAGLRKLRASQSRGSGDLRERLVQRVPGWLPLILSAALSLLVVRSVVPLIGARNLIFADSAPVGISAFIGPATETAAHRIFVLYVAALLASGGLFLTASTLWMLRTRWRIAVGAAIAVQLLTLPMLYGIMRADTPRPVVSFGGDQRMFLVWEEGDTMVFVTHQKPVQVVRKQKASLPELTIVGVGSVFEARWNGEVSK
jgi:hypothetical protein